LTQEELKRLMDYDPETGIFRRKVRTSNRIKAGEIAGTHDVNGYLIIRLAGKARKLHRLAWLWVYGN